MVALSEGASLLQGFGVYEILLPFLLIFALMYGILSKVKPFGDHKTINLIISFVTAMFFIAVSKSSTFLLNFLPLVSAFLLILLLVILIFTFIGVPADSIKEAFMQPSGYGSIIVIFIIIIFVVLSQTYPEKAIITQPELADQFNITPEEAGTSTLAGYLGQQVVAVIFSPMILGVIVLLLLFGAATYYITREKPDRK